MLASRAWIASPCACQRSLFVDLLWSLRPPTRQRAHAKTASTWRGSRIQLSVVTSKYGPTGESMGRTEAALRSRTLKNFAFGLVTAFIGRDNDTNGYWAPGVLCRRAIEAGVDGFEWEIRELRTDPKVLLAGISLHHLATVISRNHAVFRTLDLVRLKVSFAPTPGSAGRVLTHTGIIEVQLTSDWRQVRAHSTFRCWPHKPAWESRSTRIAGPVLPHSRDV